MLRSIGLPELLVLMVFTFGLVVPFWKIFAKLGFSGWLSLLMVVPLANIVVLYVVALAHPNQPPPPLSASSTRMPGRAPFINSGSPTSSFCTKCGTAMSGDAAFCGVCGSPRNSRLANGAT